MTKYTMTTSVNDGPFETDVVDEQFVENFTSVRTRSFFISLGGSESLRRSSSGVIRAVSISPDRATKRVTIFTPRDEG